MQIRVGWLKVLRMLGGDACCRLMTPIFCLSVATGKLSFATADRLNRGNERRSPCKCPVANGMR
jgi:hypothetical protein